MAGKTYAEAEDGFVGGQSGFIAPMGVDITERR